MAWLRPRVLGVAVAGLLILSACGISGMEAGTVKPDIALKDRPSFHLDIQPILDQYCIKCHEPRDAHGELRLNDYDGVMQGFYGGIIVVPGRPQDSLMIKVLKREVSPDKWMPFHQEPLTPNRISIIERWILTGAPNN